MSLLFLFSCDKQEKQIDLLNEQSLEDEELQAYRKPTEEEYRMLIEKGYIDGSRSLNCEWSDGQYGSINCDGGVCGVLIIGDPATDVCLLCYLNGQPHHAGACRPL